MPTGRDHRVARGLIPLLLATALAAGAGAQDRSGQARRDLLELARVLGEAHALRQGCAPDDQTWRARMSRMIEVEAPDQAFEAELAERFNAGYDAAGAAHRGCAPTIEAAAAERGRAIAQRLARSP